HPRSQRRGPHRRRQRRRSRAASRERWMRSPPRKVVPRMETFAMPRSWTTTGRARDVETRMRTTAPGRVAERETMRRMIAQERAGAATRTRETTGHEAVAAEMTTRRTMNARRPDAAAVIRMTKRKTSDHLPDGDGARTTKRTNDREDAAVGMRMRKRR